MLNCKSKVRILAPDSDYVVRTAHPALVASMVGSQIARVESRDARGLVVSIRLTGELVASSYSPGSFGICREIVDNGTTHHSILFQHHRLGRAA